MQGTTLKSIEEWKQQKHRSLSFEEMLKKNLATVKPKYKTSPLLPTPIIDETETET